MAERVERSGRRAVGVRDIPLVLLAPRRLFSRVEDTTAYGWPFLVLLTVVTLSGYTTVQTGLIDREVDRRVRERIARIESMQRDVVERSALRVLYEQEYKKGAFERLLTGIQVVVAAPLTTLGSTLLIAAVLYGAVALTGRKAEWHTLLTIVVFAGYIDLLRLLVRLGLMLSQQALDVDTSPAPLLRLLPAADALDATWRAVVVGGLTALDPFRLWFWWTVRAGLSATAQLQGWRAGLVCVLCWLTAAGLQCGLAVATVMSAPAPAAAP